MTNTVVTIETDAGVDGTRRILELVESLDPDDLCICLLSGGGSALLPLPIEGVSLADKQAITTSLSAAGANIRHNAPNCSASGVTP